MTLVQSFLDATPMPAVFVASGMRIVGANDGARKLNPSAGDPGHFVLVFRQPSLGSALETCLTTGAAQKAIYHHTDGPHEIRYEVTVRRVQGGEIDGCLLCFNDTTHLKQADQMRRDFVANVSHELRTPLTAILGFIETLQGPARGDLKAQDRFLATMASEAGRMNRLVGDLLSLSRVEEGARVRPTDILDLDQLIRSTVRNLSPVAEDVGGTLTYIAPDEPPKLPADSDQLLQVFTNLIENALKYGGQGTEVTIRITKSPHDHVLRVPVLRISIEDTGPGIAPTHIPRLTERFYRIDSHRSREMGGTGLGLAIVKHILNRHRGRLAIQSTVGEGSVFTVILPLG